MALKQRTEIHLSRKLFHVFSGTIIMLLFVNTFTRFEGMILTVTGTLIIGMVDILRLAIPPLNDLTLKLMGPLMREQERNEPSAQLYYLFGLCWAIGILPRPVAVQAILTMSWMDPVAAIFGIRFGRIRWNAIFRTSVGLGAKTVEGSLAGFLAAFLAGIIAWTGPWASFPVGGHLWWPEPWLIFILSTVGGISGLLAEGWPSQWDDNVNIPFWSGLTVWVTALILGAPMRFL